MPTSIDSATLDLFIKFSIITIALHCIIILLTCLNVATGLSHAGLIKPVEFFLLSSTHDLLTSTDSLLTSTDSLLILY